MNAPRRLRDMILLVAAALSLGACRVRSDSEPGEVQRPMQPIEEVLAQHRDSLMRLPGVVGTAIGLCDGEPCIRVMFSDSASLARQRIEPTLDGHRVKAEVTGPFRARPDTSM